MSPPSRFLSIQNSPSNPAAEQKKKRKYKSNEQKAWSRDCGGCKNARATEFLVPAPARICIPTLISQKEQTQRIRATNRGLLPRPTIGACKFNAVSIRRSTSRRISSPVPFSRDDSFAYQNKHLFLSFSCFKRGHSCIHNARPPIVSVLGANHLLLALQLRQREDGRSPPMDARIKDGCATPCISRFYIYISPSQKGTETFRAYFETLMTHPASDVRTSLDWCASIRAFRGKLSRHPVCWRSHRSMFVPF